MHPEGVWSSLPYMVESGDNLVGIRKKFVTQHPELCLCVGLLRWVNATGQYLHPGQTLRIPTDTPRVDVYLDARLLVYRAAWRHDQGEDIRHDTYMIKVFCDEMAFRNVDRCMQIHGGIGFTTDLPIEKFWRDQRSLVTTEGAPEVMRMVLARHVLRIYD